MPQAVPEIVASDPPFDRLPVTIDQKSSRASALIMLLLLVPALLIVVVPVGLLAAFAAPALGIAADNPVAAAQVLIGIGIWTLLFVVPAKRIIQRFGSVRKIGIDARVVTVSDVGPFCARAWSAPLTEFSGIAHHVRATISGLHHELILVHGERGKSVLLHAADRISQATVERAATLLRLPEIPAQELYRFSVRRKPAAPTASVLVQTRAA